MLNEVKFGLKLVKYGFKIKWNMIMMAVFLLIGFTVEIISQGTQFLGGFYLIITAMFSYQMIISMDISPYIQSSKWKKKLQTTTPAYVSSVLYILILTAVLIERSIIIYVHPEKEHEALASFAELLILLIIAIIYTGFAYKYFIISTVGLFAAVMVVFVSGAYENICMSIAENINIAGMAVLAYAGVIIGTVIEIVISQLLYKKEISAKAFPGMNKM